VDRTDQASVLVDASFGEITEQMSATSSDCEILPASIADCPYPDSHYGTRRKLGSRADELFFWPAATGQQFDG
jgi:hypothetical protein